MALARALPLFLGAIVVPKTIDHKMWGSMTDVVTSEFGTFAQIPTALLHSDVSPRAKLLFAFLWDYAQRDTGRATPSRKRLAADLAVSVDTLDRAVAELVKAGWLAVRARVTKEGDRTSNEYRLLVGGGRTDAATGSRTHAATVAAPQVQEPEPLEPEVDTDVSTSAEVAIPRHDVERLCQLLSERVRANGVRQAKGEITPAWRDAARLLLDRDGVSLAEALRVLNWSQDDDFWRSNILSMPKFREKYDQLKLASVRKTGYDRKLTNAEEALELSRKLRERRNVDDVRRDGGGAGHSLGSGRPPGDRVDRGRVA